MLDLCEDLKKVQVTDVLDAELIFLMNDKNIYKRRFRRLCSKSAGDRDESLVQRFLF